MPLAIQTLLDAAHMAEDLPPVVVVHTNAMRDLRSLLSRRERDAPPPVGTRVTEPVTGLRYVRYPAFVEIDASTSGRNACRLLLRLCRSRRIDNGDCRVVLVSGIGEVSASRQSTIVSSMDRVIDRARIILGVSRGATLSPNIQSRSVATILAPGRTTSDASATKTRVALARIVDRILRKLSGVALTGLRIDDATRRVTTWATEAAVKHCGGDMGAFVRVWYRGAARRGGEYACLCPVLVRCAHALTHTPRTEVHVLLCCVMEAIATLQSASLADEA